LKKLIYYALLLITTISLNAQSKDDVAVYYQQKNWSKVINTATKVLQSIPNDPELIYWRSLAYYYDGNIDKCLSDIESAISVDSNYSPVYLFKAQLMYAKNEKEIACRTLKKAISLGVSQAKQLEQQYCGSVTEIVNESLALDWPDEEKWKLANRNSEKGVTVLEFVREEESLENWTEFGSMMVIPKNGMKLTAQNAMSIFEKSAKQQSKSVEVNYIESKEDIEYPWIIFKIENQKSSISDNYESQVYSIVVGKNNLFVSFRAIKEKTIPSEIKDKWIAFFKTAKVVNGR